MRPQKYPWPQWTDGQLRHIEFAAVEERRMKTVRTALAVRASRLGLKVKTSLIRLEDGRLRLAFQFGQPDRTDWEPLFAGPAREDHNAPEAKVGGICRTCGGRERVKVQANLRPCPECVGECQTCRGTLVEPNDAGTGLRPCRNPYHRTDPVLKPQAHARAQAVVEDHGAGLISATEAESAYETTRPDDGICRGCGMAWHPASECPIPREEWILE